MRTALIFIMTMLLAGCSTVEIANETEGFRIDKEGRYVVFPFSDPPGGYRAVSGKGDNFREIFMQHCAEYGVGLQPIYGKQLSAGEKIDLEEAIKIAKKNKANFMIFGKATKWKTPNRIDGKLNTGLEVKIQGVYSKKIVFKAELVQKSTRYSDDSDRGIIEDLSKEMALSACR